MGRSLPITHDSTRPRINNDTFIANKFALPVGTTVIVGEATASAGIISTHTFRVTNTFPFRRISIDVLSWL
jgi:hypothetical protein